MEKEQSQTAEARFLRLYDSTYSPYLSVNKVIRRYWERYEKRDLTTIDSFQVEVDRATRELLNSALYRQALAAYHQNDQKALRLLLPRIFEVLVTRPCPVFHGVYPKPEGELEVERVMDITKTVSPAKYVGKIAKIAKEGLIPGLRSHDYGSDENLRAVYFADTRDGTYGPCFFYLDSPRRLGYTLFRVTAMSEEKLIFTPKIPPAFLRLGLKSSQYGSSVIGPIDDDPAWGVYRGEVEEELKRQGILFQKFDPEELPS